MSGIYVTALSRGGYGVSGQGAWYDPRCGIVRLGVAHPDNAIPITVEFNDTPTDVDYDENGISSTPPVIDGDSVSIVFQALNPNGTYKLVTHFALGSQTTWFQASRDQPITDGAVTADIDYGVV
jgi:hypothetical protein